MDEGTVGGSGRASPAPAPAAAAHPQVAEDRPRHRLHGLTLSYFTGKLEAYMRAKGLAYDFVEMDMADFRACARATGVAQMPQLQAPSGEWLTDTTAIIARFEAGGAGPALKPAAPLDAFFSQFLEDYFDEWLWRPALYYRWRFEEDARLMSAQIARTMLRDLPGPFWMKRLSILLRQRRVFLHEDGVTAANGPAVEALFHATLDALEPIFAARPYLFGQRPCEADFGLFGSMFRHFSHDPTPQDLMRRRAPHTLAWVARLWAASPQAIEAAPPLAGAPADLDPFLAEANDGYLPYLAANAAAWRAGASSVRAEAKGGVFITRPSPYHVRCLDDLKRAFAALAAADRAAAAARIGPSAGLLAEPLDEVAAIPAAGRPRPTDRAWRR
ncbi:MAG: glutathione S-transferase N-terminal domain-containing protein [Phenylobacterium sp.]|uniref:glutathione S-transferase N-terminal domain-containing protein n=1 Tax=Phenylobacterium sp. TaxID=1871053 RepID=UPI00391A08BA